MIYHCWFFRLILVVAGVVFLSNCFLDLHTSTTANQSLAKGGKSLELTAEEYTVYSTLLEITYALSENPLVISSGTSAYYMPFASPVEALDNLDSRTAGGISAEVRSNFILKNNLPGTIERFDTLVPYTLLSQGELESIFKGGGGWDEFFRRYPKRKLVTLSRIGFSNEKDKALVYMSTSGGPKTGGGHYFLLCKVENRWIVEQELEIWTS